MRKKVRNKIEPLDQYDFPWNEDEFIFLHKEEYSGSIGEFLISFSNLESALNLMVVNLINGRGHELGYKVIKSLSYSNKIHLAKDLYLLNIELISNQKTKEKKREEFKLILEKLNDLGESRNRIAHANWVTLDKYGYVRTKISSDESGLVHFIKIKITPKLMQKWARVSDRLASQLFQIP